MKCKPAQHLQAALRQITGKTPWIYSFAHTVAVPPLCMNKLNAALILRLVHMTYGDGWFDKGYSVWIRNISLLPSTVQLFIHNWFVNIFYIVPTNIYIWSSEIIAISTLSPRILAHVKRTLITGASIKFSQKFRQTIKFNYCQIFMPYSSRDW